MYNDPRKNLKWLEQQLLQEEALQDLTYQTDADVEADPENRPLGNFSRKSRGARAEQAHIRHQFDEDAAVLTKTKGQRRKEARQQKIAEKKSHVNRNIKGLVVLALLEIMGILCILGWWLQ